MEKNDNRKTYTHVSVEKIYEWGVSKLALRVCDIAYWRQFSIAVLLIIIQSYGEAQIIEQFKDCTI